MKNIVVAGCAILDTIKQTDVYPEPTSLAMISGLKCSLGGALCNIGIDPVLRANQ